MQCARGMRGREPYSYSSSSIYSSSSGKILQNPRGFCIRSCNIPWGRSRSARSTERLLRGGAGFAILVPGDAHGSGKDRGADRGGPKREEYDPEGAGGGPACVGQQEKIPGLSEDSAVLTAAMRPPFSFRSCRKENGPRPVQKKRTLGAEPAHARRFAYVRELF